MSLLNFGFQMKANKQSAFQTKKQPSSKKRKWNDAFAELGFVKNSDDKYPSARCVFLPCHTPQFIAGKV